MTDTADNQLKVENSAKPRDSQQKERRIVTQTVPPGCTQMGINGQILTAECSHTMGDGAAATVQSPLQQMRDWSIGAIRSTKQLMLERIGRASRSTDAELEAAVAELRDCKRRYEQLQEAATSLTRQHEAAAQSQLALADSLRTAAAAEPMPLSKSLANSAEHHAQLAIASHHLLRALRQFSNSLATIVTKAFEDTFATISDCELARMKYDATRVELEAAVSCSRANPQKLDGDELARIKDLKYQLQLRQQQHERLKQNVKVKLQFLQENRGRVLQQQLSHLDQGIRQHCEAMLHLTADCGQSLSTSASSTAQADK